MKFTVLLKRKSKEVKISILTISHEELTFQKNYNNFAVRRVLNVV